MTSAAKTTTPTKTAIVQDRYGSAEVLERRQVGRPDIGDTEVLIRVIAAGVNPADWAITSGLPYIARPVYGLKSTPTSRRPAVRPPC